MFIPNIGSRGVGKTHAICEAAKKIDGIVICATQKIAAELHEKHGVHTICFDQIELLAGICKPVLWDHLTVEQILYRLDRKESKLRRIRRILDE